jgi:copper chaperone CopZ
MSHIITWRVDGLNDSKDAHTIEQALKVAEGVKDVEVSLSQKRAGVELIDVSNLSAIESTINSLTEQGYIFQIENNQAKVNKDKVKKSAATPSVKSKINNISESVWPLVFLVIVVFVFAGILHGVTSLIGGEREGTIVYDDCRETIKLKTDTFQKYYKKFTCDYFKTNSGKIYDGECVHINKSWFGSDCQTAYIYERSPDVCPSDSKAFINSDDTCTCYQGYFFDEKTKKCIK